MSKSLEFGLIAVLALGFASTSNAQRAGVSRPAGAVRSAGAAASGHSIGHARSTSRPAPTRSALTGATNRNLANGTNISPAVPNSLPAFGALGFDCENLGCNSGNLGVEALIDPATRANLELALRFARLGALTGTYFITGFGGYPMGYDEPQADTQNQEPAPPPQPQQPQIIVIQQPPATEKPGPSAEAAPEPSALDIGDFALVLKNGNQFTAVAFTRRDDQLVYITHDGNRRTVNISDVDTAATTKVNEDRGTPFKLPIKSDPPARTPARSADSSS